MHPGAYLRLDVEAEVYVFEDTRSGKAEASRHAKDAQRLGRGDIHLYRVSAGAGTPTLIRKYKPQTPSAFYKTVAKRIESTGIPARLDLPSQPHAALLMDCLFAYPNGSVFVEKMALAVEPSVPRETKEIRGLFILRAARRGAELQFSLLPTTTDGSSLVACLRLAGKGDPRRLAKTRHAPRNSTGRVRSISRSISR